MRFVLIPLNSGLVFTSQNNLEVAAALVLIPLNSGLVFTLKIDYAHVAQAWVLIPLNSGLVFTSGELKEWIVKFGLNPFEFRAGIYLS